MAKHQCIQFGSCPRANNGECFEVNVDFKCGRTPEDPDCQLKLEPVGDGGGGRGLALKIGIPVALLCVAGIIFYLVIGKESISQSLPAAQKPSAEVLLQGVWPSLKKN